MGAANMSETYGILEAIGLMEFFLPEAMDIMVDGVGAGVGCWLLI